MKFYLLRYEEPKKEGLDRISTYFLMNENGENKTLPRPFHAWKDLVRAIKEAGLIIEPNVPEDVLEKIRGKYNTRQFIVRPRSEDLLLFQELLGMK